MKSKLACTSQRSTNFISLTTLLSSTCSYILHEYTGRASVMSRDATLPSKGRIARLTHAYTCHDSDSDTVTHLPCPFSFSHPHIPNVSLDLCRWNSRILAHLLQPPSGNSPTDLPQTCIPYLSQLNTLTCPPPNQTPRIPSAPWRSHYRAKSSSAGVPFLALSWRRLAVLRANFISHCVICGRELRWV